MTVELLALHASDMPGPKLGKEHVASAMITGRK